MDKLAIEAFLRKPYPGWKDFMQGFIVPLFEGADVDDKRGADQLNDDLRNMAKRCGIVGVRYLAEVSVVSTDFKVFDVTVSDQVCLQRNRVTVQQLIRKIVGQGNAFMAFHYKDDKSEWRFSFCQKIADAASNAKRHTFLLGEKQNVRTVTANFVQLRETLSAKGYLEDADLIKCFDVEALSKEFFAKYKKFYEKFVDYASKHDLKQLYKRDEKAVRDYIKKMMGRLVFLQFLQKKGWLGVPKGRAWGEGDRQFLQNLFKAATPKQKDAFLDEILEHIFFHALNDSSRADGELFDTKVKAYGSDGGKVKVPYLNGGLFESDQEDDSACAFPKAYFSNPEDAENDPGLLDFFSQYNFTIDENDPTEAEVGVDPEMLSCIFENLLEDNKDKGAYYTPKAIVEYMCRESLTAYLQTEAKDADKEKIAEFVKSHDAEPLSKSLAKSIDGKLRKVKICDPAIGSGAFPMGLLRELQLCRTALEDDTKSAAEIKKEIIQNNIYGVDIEKGAVDIARLRFWLSLVVDEPTPAALPNLDFKIMQGNSLLESYKGVDLGGLLAGGLPQKKKKASQGKLALGKCVQSFTQGELAFGGDSAAEIITTKMREYYDESDHDKKAKIMEDINTQVKGYIKTQLGSAAPEKEIDALNPQNDKFFLWHTWFNDAFANGGFDIVIGNPPYINAIEYSKIVSEAEKKVLNETYETACGAWDVYVLFFERGLRMLRQGGILGYITPNKYLSATYGRALRAFFVRESSLRTLMDVSMLPVFESVSVYPVISIYERRDQKPEIMVLAPKRIENVVMCNNGRLLPSSVMTICPDFIWGLFLSDKIPLLQKVFKQRRRLENVAEVNATSTAAEADAFGTFFADQKGPTGTWMKVVNTGTIDPYCSLWGKKNLTHQKKKYCTPYLPIEGAHVNARRASIYAAPKLIFAKLGNRVEAFFDAVGEYASVNTNCVYSPRSPYGLKFLLGICNSKVFSAIYDALFGSLRMNGGYMQFQAPQLRVMPIPEAERDQQKPIITLVDKILAAKAKDAQADTSELESQIDALVYDLYGLTEEEIAVVEGK